MKKLIALILMLALALTMVSAASAAGAVMSGSESNGAGAARAGGEKGTWINTRRGQVLNIWTFGDGETWYNMATGNIITNWNFNYYYYYNRTITSGSSWLYLSGTRIVAKPNTLRYARSGRVVYRDYYGTFLTINITQCGQFNIWDYRQIKTPMSTVQLKYSGMNSKMKVNYTMIAFSTNFFRSSYRMKNVNNWSSSVVRYPRSLWAGANLRACVYPVKVLAGKYISGPIQTYGYVYINHVPAAKGGQRYSTSSYFVTNGGTRLPAFPNMSVSGGYLY